MKIDNAHIVSLIKEIIDSPGDTIPEPMAFKLMDYLKGASFITPSGGHGLQKIRLGPNIFIPACCDIDDYKRIFGDDDYEIVEFGKFSKYLDWKTDGIIINPGSFGFIVNDRMANIVFNRIYDDEKLPPVKAFDVKVRLNDFRPLTWRDLLIPDNMTFKELDDALKTLWGFNGHHLSMFFVKNADVHIMDRTVAEACMNDDYHDSRFTTVGEIFENFKKVTYWYDFGDDWQFDIEIKKSVDYNKNYITIKRFKGKYNPIEDCQGVYGLSEIIWYFENPEMRDDSYFSDLCEYLCEFDMEYAQKRLKNKDYVRSLHDEEE